MVLNPFNKILFYVSYSIVPHAICQFIVFFSSLLSRVKSNFKGKFMTAATFGKVHEGLWAEPQKFFADHALYFDYEYDQRPFSATNFVRKGHEKY